MSRLLGAVLAGGRSSRFGRDKATARLGGVALVEHARALLAPWCDAVVTVGGEHEVADLPAPGLGPLGGIAGALDHAASHGFRCVLTIACDMPRLPDDLIEALLRRGPAFCDDAPVLGHWQAAAGAHLLAWLQSGEDRSVRAWARAIGALPIASRAAIPNVNTPADLAAIEAEALLTA